MYSKHGKKVYLTATPQCTFPDHLVGNALETGKIMFGLNFTTHHASTVQAICLTLKMLGSSGLSDIPATRIFEGLPTASQAAVSGFNSSRSSRPHIKVLPAIKNSAKYGGVTLWSKYYDDLTGFSSSNKNDV